MLVAYFSLAGEQYGVGVVEEGNTGIIAHMIAEQTGADLFEIKPETPYPTIYQEILDVSRQEMADNVRPAITDTVENMDAYDTIFIGYPNWWGDMPMIFYNFLESYDLSGKTIVPFCTLSRCVFRSLELGEAATARTVHLPTVANFHQDIISHIQVVHQP